MSFRCASPLGTALLFVLFSGACFAAEAAGPSGRTDSHGDPLPPGTLLRLGTVRWRACARFLAFTPDGKTLVTGEYPLEGVIRCWDTATGKETASFHVDSGLLAVALSPDGKTLAVDEDSRGIVFRSVPDGKEIRRLQATTTVPGGNLYFLGLNFSANGKTLAAGGNDGVVRIYDVATGKMILHLAGDVGYSYPALLSADGARVAVAGAKNTLRVVEIATEKELFKQQVQPDDDGAPLNASFSPDGKKLAWMGEDAKTFALWEIASGKPVLQFRSPSEAVNRVRFSPDGQRIAARYSGKEGGCIRLWDAETGKELQQLVPADQAADEFTFSPDGKRLAAGNDFDGVVHVWNVETGKELSRFGEHQGIVCSVAFSPDGRTAFTGCADHVVRLWDADRGTVLRRIEVAGVGGYPIDYRIVLSNDRKTTAVTNFKHNAQIWDLDSGKKRADLDGGEDKAWVAAFSPDGKLLASRGNFGTGIQFWDAATGKKASRLGVDDDGLGEFAFSPDGKTLVVMRNPSNPAGGPEPAEMSLWDIASGKEVGKWPTRIKWGAFGVQFSPDGRRIAVIRSSEVDLWNPAGPRELASLLVPKDVRAPGYLGCLAFSPDGRTLAAGYTKGPICLWEVGTGKVRTVLIGHRDRVMSLDFSPDGSRLISGSNDTTALIWDLTGLADEKDAKTLTPERLASLWDELADGDAGKAWRAGWRLAADPAASVPFLQKHLRPAQVDAKQVAALLAALDGDDFDGREKATRELAKLGDLAGPALRQTLEGKPSPEARRRLEELARKLDRPIEDAEEARALRGVEALEHIGSAEARKLLEELSRGAAGARRTREATAALERLNRTAASP